MSSSSAPITPPASPDEPVFTRRVVLEAHPGRVVASVEDHQHHFVVTVHHDGERVERFEVEGVRIPWAICTDAAAELDELVGAPVGERPVTDRVDRHCTHQIDLAQVAVRFAGLGVARREYQLEVTGYLEPLTRATLVRDDGLSFRWDLQNGVITNPPHDGRSLHAGFSGWVGSLGPDDAEAVSLLRRAVWLAPSRLFDLDGYASMGEVGMPEGVCYSAQPERIHLALRVPRRSFS